MKERNTASIGCALATFGFLVLVPGFFWTLSLPPEPEPPPIPASPRQLPLEQPPVPVGTAKGVPKSVGYENESDLRKELKYLAEEVRNLKRKREDPCALPISSLQALKTCTETTLSRGRIAFDARKVMKQGKEEIVSIRISPDLRESILGGFQGKHPAIKEIRVAPIMRSVLSFSPSDFDVIPIGREEKLLLEPFTEWSWRVTPLESGEKELVVLVYADIVFSEASKESFEAFIGSSVIHVQSRPTYIARRFFEKQWQWLLGSPTVIGLSLWLWARLAKARRPRRAGY